MKNCFDICEADITVTKRLLTVSRVPLAGLISTLIDSSLPENIHYAQLLLTYEVLLINNTPYELQSIVLNDSLAGLNFENGGISALPFPASLDITKSSGNLILLTPEQIASSEGSLVDSEKSYLPPCSVTKLLINLSLFAPKNSIVEIRKVCNTITLEGILKINNKNKEGKKCLTYKKIRPIAATSDIWSTESDFGFIVGVNLNINLNVPV